jgi:transposase
MFLLLNTRIWFHRHPVDFRKQMNGLILMVADQLGQNPANGDIYIFRSRSARKIKLLFWHLDGFWLCQKRMEKRRFHFPGIVDEQIVLTSVQFQWLLSGINIIHAPPQEVPPTRFF